MKKTYRMPQTTSVRFDVEGMLAASTPTSLGIFEDEDTGVVMVFLTNVI